MGTKYRFKTKPYKHQAHEIRTLFKRGYGGGLLWEPGTGKTKTIVDWLSILHIHPDHRLKRALVVCPLSVVGVWDEEIEMHSPLWDSGDLMIDRYERGITDGFEAYKGGLTIAIINYDSVWRDLASEMVKEFDPQAVICDESHRIKKPSARRSWYMRRHNRTRYRAILTGTPTPKSFYDLYGQWVFLNRRTFGTNAGDFKDRYLLFRQRYGKSHSWKELRGYRNVKELRRKVRSDATTLRKDECLDLPDEVYQRVPVYLEPDVIDLYQKLSKEYFLELQTGETVDAKNVLSKIGKLQQITGGWVFTEQGVRQISEAKFKSLEDLLYDRFEVGKKVVVFARYRPEVDAIHGLGIRRFGVETHLLRGGIKTRDRDTARRLFQTRPGPSLFVAQIQSGGLGITLHSSHESIFYSVTHALDDYDQARGRLHRAGQLHKVTYRHLVCKGTIDIDIYAALRQKRNITDVVMGRPKILVTPGG